MEAQREETDLAGDCRELMEEAGKELSLSYKIETLDCEVDVPQQEPCIEDANTDSGVCDASGSDENPNDEGLATEDGNTGNSFSDENQGKADVGGVEEMVGSVSSVVEVNDNVEKTVGSDDAERTDAITEPETERSNVECEGAVEVEIKKTILVEDEMKDEMAMPEIKRNNGEIHESEGEEECLTSAVDELTDEKAKCEVEDNSGAPDADQNVQTEISQQSSVNGDMFNNQMGVDSEQKKEEKVGLSYNEQGNSGCETSDADQEDNNKMDVDSTHAKEENLGNLGSETTYAKHSESAQVPEESTQLIEGETNEGNPGIVSDVSFAAEICREEEISNVNQQEENGEAMEIDDAADEQVEKDVKVDGALDNAGNESGGASMVQPQDVPIAEAGRNDSNVKEMEIDERNDNVDMATDLTGTIESNDSAPDSPTEDAATGEVEPLDHNALFDPSSDITNFIDFTGVSSWSGNIQDLKTETGNFSLKEDKKAIDMAEEVAREDCKYSIQNESSEACIAFGAESATYCPREASDAILGSDEYQEDKDHEYLDKKTIDQQDDITHEAPSIDPNQKEDTEMEENPNNSDYADDGTNSHIKTNRVKRKADVLSEDSPVEGRKSVSFAKVSFEQRPSFKIGACIARAASQMAGTPSCLKGGNFSDETLSVESFVSQLHCAATEPVKGNVVSEIAAGFFVDFRNSSASQQVTPEMVSSKRPSNSNAGGTEAFEFEEMGDTYWTDKVIHNGGEEQKPPTEKGNYQVMPVELKPAQVQRTRRPYRRRQSQIGIPLSASEKPANFDENAPAELIMSFSETDTIPPEKSLSKMFRHFGPIRESETEVDKENNRARVVYRKGADAEVAYNSAGRFSIFGTKTVNYKLSYTITETFKVQPYVVSLSEEDAALCLPS